MAFLIVSIVIFITAAFRIKKKIPPIVCFGAFYFAALLALTTDVILDIKYQLYGYFRQGQVDMEGFLVMFGIYPASNVLIVNGFPYHKPWIRKLIYVVLWSIFCVAYEAAAIHFNIFYHAKWWNLWWSAACYPVLIVLLVLHTKFLLWLTKERPSPN